MTPPSPPLDRRPRRVSWILRGAVLVVVVAATAWLVFSSTYAPLSTGSFSAPETPSIKALTDGVARTRYIVDGPAGQQGKLAFDLSNDGEFAVRVDGLASDRPRGIVAAGWVPLPRNDELVGGRAADVRPFPVTIEPGTWIVLWVTVVKPRCQQGEQTGIEDIPLRWSALGRHHVYSLPLSETAGGVRQLALCHPAGALDHLEFPEG